MFTSAETESGVFSQFERSVEASLSNPGADQMMHWDHVKRVSVHFQDSGVVRLWTESKLTDLGVWRNKIYGFDITSRASLLMSPSASHELVQEANVYK